ncbi:cytochrome C oxidase subunit IV family protein [Vitiosangium sp. GDMCC 1.1324]|uniref:cytochrome C oxidase subunit IV family protein n=1 Tax=Vitiosangium sp. (strain GDMCC 1.1324) TaxID=2138576 RepID=UPI000D343E9C|nr:cytochrome C oxidase subunit IV family protein [Vitiosangium sp. GDMCC 1.1324]PTL84039.1 cytochrome-c oxidase [Vitiosangium sp. GDMCC 1.1324]
MSAMANESLKEDREMREEHHSGPGRYVLVWGALMVLTVVTVLTGRMHLPDYGLLLALVIATVKGGLVALFFMHLAEHKGANRLVFGTSMLFVVLLLVFTLFDFGTRFRPALAPNGTPPEWPVETGQRGKYGGLLQSPDSHP